jgi:hypothetical protein
MKNISGNRSCLELLVPILIIVAFMFALSMTPLPLFAADDLGPHLKGLSRDEVLRMGEVMYPAYRRAAAILAAFQVQGHPADTSGPRVGERGTLPSRLYR